MKIICKKCEEEIKNKEDFRYISLSYSNNKPYTKVKVCKNCLRKILKIIESKNQ